MSELIIKLSLGEVIDVAAPVLMKTYGISYPKTVGLKIIETNNKFSHIEFKFTEDKENTPKKLNDISED